MTEQGRHDDATPPGRPLWAAAERARVAAGVAKFDWVKEIGIGRVTYDRLATQTSPPIARTVKKIADRISLDYDEAMRLAGLAGQDHGVDLIVIRDGQRVLVQAKHFQRAGLERHLDALRKMAAEAGRTLGDILVITDLATERELEVSGQQLAAAYSETPDEQDQERFFTVEFLAGINPPRKR